jgi:hypothetical protein
MDYFAPNMGIAAYPTGGANATITYTLDDPNVTSPAAIYFALPAPFNVAVTANTVATISQTPVRAFKCATTVSGTCDYVFVQPSGESLTQ